VEAQSSPPCAPAPPRTSTLQVPGRASMTRPSLVGCGVSWRRDRAQRVQHILGLPQHGPDRCLRNLQIAAPASLHDSLQPQPTQGKSSPTVAQVSRPACLPRRPSGLSATTKLLRAARKPVLKCSMWRPGCHRRVHLHHPEFQRSKFRGPKMHHPHLEPAVHRLILATFLLFLCLFCKCLHQQPCE
jgi:hypothetical protein